ncbi:MAG: hypothetical protein HWD58_10370 [Bacteroidota bacterium]|nr:MAG: hypothetical protein HWD58_10370 [Bacteroidota bacterium]
MLTQVTSDYSPIGHQINTTRTGTGNPSFSYGQTINVNGNEQDAYGSNIYVTNANSAGGFTTGEFIQSVQNGNANNYGQQIVASTNSASSTNTTIGSWVSANAPNSNQGRVTAIIGSVGGDVQVIGIQGNATGKWDATTGTTDAFGVFGQAFGGFGNADYAYSIYGASATGALTNYAGYFNGNTHINGTLSKSSGTFKIDHPQDPENKYLIHSFVESPDMMNVYNGNIITDNDGNATIELPAYFEAENKDFKYQLTVIDNSNDFVMAKVTEKVFNNTFKIKTSKPNVEVSWQVTGVRQDAWANAHRVVPEVEKGEREKGKYLNPEVFGKDASYALNPQPQDAKATMSEKEKSRRSQKKKLRDACSCSGTTRKTETAGVG